MNNAHTANGKQMKNHHRIGTAADRTVTDTESPSAACIAVPDAGPAAAPAPAHASAGGSARTAPGFMLIAVLALLFGAGVLRAQTAKEIMDQAEDKLQGETSKGTYEMNVVTPEYTRHMKMEYWWDGKNDRALIKTIAPKKEAGNKWLKIGNEMWNYLKTTETTIKIPPSMMLQSWNGSDFTNDDLARESDVSDDYTHAIIAEEKINGEECWKIASTPKPEAAVVWGRLYTWVRKDALLPSIVQYYDEKGTLVRYMVYSDFETMDGRLIPTKWTMYNKVEEGHRTEFIIDKVDFNVDIPERIFSFRELERGN